MEIIKEHHITHDNYYDDTSYITNSMLSKLSEKSPSHFRYWLDNKPEATPAMKLGSAIHSAILTPREFNKNYVVAPEIDKRTKAGKEEWAKFVEKNTKNIITFKDKQMIKELYYNFYADNYIKKLFTKGKPEQIICFYDDISKLKCKSMIDYLRDDGVIIDLKTTTDASNNFLHSVNRYKYHKQAAFYMDAVNANRFIIVAVEKTKPYALNVFELSKETIQEGRELYRNELQTMAQCQKDNFWPSYGHEFLGNVVYEKQVTII